MEKSSQSSENNKKKKNVRKNKNTEPETEVTTNYKQWTTRETEKLLELLIEATLEKKKDTSGCFTKRIVEEEILPKLNQACGCDKSFENYKGKHRWLKTRFGQYQDLFKSCTSGFGWNDANKMITGSDEMWNNYFESHSNQTNLREDNGKDYGDLLIVFGNKCASGKVTVDLTHEGTSARTCDKEDEQDNYFDVDYTQREQYDSAFNVSYVGYGLEESDEQDKDETQDMNTTKIPVRKTAPKKRPRCDIGDSSTSTNPTGQSDYLEKLIANSSSIAYSIDSMHALIAKEKEDRKIEKEMRRIDKDKKDNQVWDLVYGMNEISLEDKLKVIEMLDNNHKKNLFIRFTPEERKLWIGSKLKA